MSRTTVRRPAYVEQIGRDLRDLPWTDRQALLDDVAAHLDAPDLPADDVGPWAERFGPPRQYARQLRDGLGMATDPDSMRRARRVHLRHSRRRTKVLIALAAAAGALTLALAVWLSTLQPITFGNRIAMGGETITADGHDEQQWTWEQGEQFAIGTGMFNDGPLPIRVTAITLPEHLLVPWDRWRVTVGDPHTLDIEPEVAFEPFSLDPDEVELIVFRGDFLRCPQDYDPGDGLGISQIDVTFEVLGITRHETLDLGFTYSVHIPETGC